MEKKKKKVLTLNDRVFFLDKYDIENYQKKKKRIKRVWHTIISLLLNIVA